MKRTPLQRKTPLQRGDSVLRRTPLAKQSAKRKREQADRRKLVARLLTERPRCQAGPLILHEQPGYRCGGWSVDIHEPLTRARGGSILDDSNALAVCRPCHDWIHQHPDAATRIGLLEHSWT